MTIDKLLRSVSGRKWFFIGHTGIFQIRCESGLCPLVVAARLLFNKRLNNSDWSLAVKLLGLNREPGELLAKAADNFCKDVPETIVLRRKMIGILRPEKQKR